MMIEPDAQGKGAGRYLLEKTMAVALERFDILRLECGGLGQIAVDVINAS